MVYKQVLIPDEKNRSIEMPKHFFGKKVEIVVMELDNATDTGLPKGKKIPASKLLESFGEAPDFPSIDDIRAKAWTYKW